MRTRALRFVLVGLLGVTAVAGWRLAATRAPDDGADSRTPEAAAASAGTGGVQVTALGRLEPRDGVVRIAGPSKPSVVVDRMLVDEGDRVTAGQTLAILDTHATLEATVERLEAELRHAEREDARQEALSRDRIVSPSERSSSRMQVDVARARLAEARAELTLAAVRAPFDGEVLEIHAREGERVGPEGIAELGRTQEMFAIAEVYETDVQLVRTGQRATITSVAMTGPLHGTVAKIHRKIGKQDVLNVDPAARTDARVVEVEIRLDESAAGAAFTNLQVDVAIAVADDAVASGPSATP